MWVVVGVVAVSAEDDELAIFGACALVSGARSDPGLRVQAATSAPAPARQAAAARMEDWVRRLPDDSCGLRKWSTVHPRVFRWHEHTRWIGRFRTGPWKRKRGVSETLLPGSRRVLELDSNTI